MFENIRLSFRGIWSHKMRSFLTMLGIIIGIASIISIVSTIKGTNEQIKQNLIGSGNNTVRIELQREDYIFDLNQEYVPDLSVVSQQTMDSIKEVDQVVNATKYLQGMADEGVFYKSNSLSGGQVLGIDESYFSTAGLIMKRGHTFSQKDYANRKKVVVLDKNAVDTLFSGINPVGKVVEIKKEPFLVIGVVTELHPFEPVIQTMEDYETFSQESGGKIYVPYSVWPEIFSYDNPEHVLIQVTGTDAMTVAGKETTKILNENFIREDQSLQYKAVDLLEQAKKIQSLSQSTNGMLLWIAGISLLVGGIGVMNIMLVTVTERTREIGLKKAIGAKKGTILFQFLTEAAVLTSIGGLLGVIFGIGLSKGISILMDTPVAISIPASVGAVLFSMLVGIIFGILPSKKAADLDPIEALRTE